MQQRTLAFIGAGNMSRSIIAGLIQAGYPAERIIAANPSRPKLDELASQFGIRITQDNAEAARELVEGNEQGCTNLVLHSAVNSVLYKLLTVKLTNLPRPDLSAEANNKPQEG